MRFDPRAGRALIQAALLVLAACGGDDSGGGLGPSQTANVAGNWTFNWTNLAGTHPGLGAVACDISGVHALLSQTNTTFSGTINGDWSISCSGAGQTVTDNGNGGVISSGVITGSQVTFNLATSDAAQTGSVSGSSMSGTAHWRLDLGSPYGVVTLDGNWGAVRATSSANITRRSSGEGAGRSTWTRAIARAFSGR